ncbi:MAG: hypothetical protein ACE5JG_05800, partial [Planctomycetota bacterium]
LLRAGRRADITDAQYYVLLPVIEVTPKKNGRKDWDGNGSGPDVFYRIRWQGKTVFQSSKKKNTFLASWSTASVEVGALARSLSLDESIKAARITARPGDELEVAVYDSDFLDNELIATWKLPVDRLRVGDQQWIRPAKHLVRVVSRVVALNSVDLTVLTR